MSKALHLDQQRWGIMSFQPLRSDKRKLLATVGDAVAHFMQTTGRAPTDISLGPNDLTTVYLEAASRKFLWSLTTWTTWPALDGIGVWVGCLQEDEVRRRVAAESSPTPAYEPRDEMWD